MAIQLPALRIDSLRLAGEPISPHTTAVLQIPRSEMGKPVRLQIDYHSEGEMSGTLKVRVTGSHLEPTHAVTESTPVPVQEQGSLELSFTPTAYGLSTLFIFVDDQPLHISMFRLAEAADQNGGGVKVISGPAQRAPVQELPLPEDADDS